MQMVMVMISIISAYRLSSTGRRVMESGVIRLEEWLPAILDNPIHSVVDQWRSLSVLEECRGHLTDLDPNGDYRLRLFWPMMITVCG